MSNSTLHAADASHPPDAVSLKTARELAASIAKGTTTARAAVEACIKRIEEVNPAFNAVVVKRYEEARGEADAIDQRRARGETLPPLAGVPITVKECFDLTGTAATFGLSNRAAARATSDDPYVARLRSAGAIVAAKTNVAQLLIYSESDNPLYGRANEPGAVVRRQQRRGGSNPRRGRLHARARNRHRRQCADSGRVLRDIVAASHRRPLSGPRKRQHTDRSARGREPGRTDGAIGR